MKFAKGLLLGTGSLVVAALALAALTPKAAHALVATLVQVANTRSTPVPNQDVDHPGRHPYQVHCTATAGPFTSSANITCSMPTVPANSEFVIQSASIFMSNVGFDSKIFPQGAQVAATGGGTSVPMFIPLTQQSPLQGQTGPTYMATVPLTLYADANTTPSCQSNLTDITIQTISCSLTGYLVSLP